MAMSEYGFYINFTKNSSIHNILKMIMFLQFSDIKIISEAIQPFLELRRERCKEF
jgi:hypothetical protein